MNTFSSTAKFIFSFTTVLVSAGLTYLFVHNFTIISPMAILAILVGEIIVIKKF